MWCFLRFLVWRCMIQPGWARVPVPYSLSLAGCSFMDLSVSPCNSEFWNRKYYRENSPKTNMDIKDQHKLKELPFPRPFFGIQVRFPGSTLPKNYDDNRKSPFISRSYIVHACFSIVILDFLGECNPKKRPHDHIDPQKWWFLIGISFSRSPFDVSFRGCIM